MDIDNIVRTLFFKIIFDNEKLEDKDLVEFLIKQGITKEESVYITLFTPIILGRIICEDLNVKFTDIYFEHLEDDTQRQGILTENIFYRKINNAVRNLIQNNSYNQEDILKIALRSPEFKLVNDFLKNESKVSDIRFSPLHINL